MYNFLFSHDDKLWIILVIKHVWNHFNQSCKNVSIQACKNIFEWLDTWPTSCEVYYNSYKIWKHLVNVWITKNMYIFYGCFQHLSTSPLHMQKDFHNIMKWFQIHRMITSWVNEHNVKKKKFISFKCYMWYIFEVNMVHKNLIVNKSFGSFNCDLTLVSCSL
jgi:hypothetical protein